MNVRTDRSGSNDNDIFFFLLLLLLPHKNLSAAVCTHTFIYLFIKREAHWVCGSEEANERKRAETEKELGIVSIRDEDGGDG